MDDDEAQGGNSHTSSSMELSKVHRCNLQARGLNYYSRNSLDPWPYRASELNGCQTIVALLVCSRSRALYPALPA